MKIHQKAKFYYKINAECDTCDIKYKMYVMIRPLWKCLTSKDCDYDRSPHKNNLSIEDRDYQKCLISEDYDYDRSPHKKIVALFLRTAMMIAVLIKCTIYEDCNYDRIPYKNIMFLSFYKIMIIIVVLFIRIGPWSQYSQKYPIFESLWWS